MDKIKNAVEILLVEDNPDDAELILRTLKKNNLSNRVIHLQDGAQAIDFIFAKGEFKEREIENKPRVVLLDLKMPKVNGLQVLKEIKSDPRTKMIPVVIMT